jgi:hypothetical protein
MVVALGALEEVKGDKSWDVFQVAVARQPNLLEIAFGTLPHLEAVHGDIHALRTPARRRSIAEKA